MKHYLLLLPILAMGILFSCEKNSEIIDPETKEEEFLKEDSSAYKNTFLEEFKGDSYYTFTGSYKKWLELKKENNDSYMYVSSFQSWIGYKSATTISVKNGFVIQRSFTDSIMNLDNGSYELVKNYEENNDELGANEDGAPPVTIDSLYHTCASDFLKIDLSENTLYFETNQEGTVSLCGYVPDNCVDDCFFGFRIDEFEWLE